MGNSTFAEQDTNKSLQKPAASEQSEFLRSWDDSSASAGDAQIRGITLPSPQTIPEVFNETEREQLRTARKVLVHEYSSTGGGHTARSLDPIINAQKKRYLTPEDCVVILAPPRWPEDKDGKKVGALHDKITALRAYDKNKVPQGPKVILKQSDKTVTGIYFAEGPSNNVEMLRDFVYKPRRGNDGIRLSNQRIKADEKTNIAPLLKGKGYRARDILDGVIDAVGEGNKHKISVLGDMAPYLQKAAKARGINNAVEIGNHQGLFIGNARNYLGDKDLSYLSKASSSGLAQKLALVEYDKYTNVVSDLAPTLRNLGISKNTTKIEAREIALTHLLNCGVKLSLEVGAIKKAGYIAGPNATTAENIGAVVYLYLNEYTQGVLDHIRKQIKDNVPAYQNALFVNCANGAIDTTKLTGGGAKEAKNVLQVMYAANADGATNAGFGTTSEFYYLAKNGSDADFVALPVENQHEQEANAANLAREFESGRVTEAHGARGVGGLYTALDDLVGRRHEDPTGHLVGNMASIVDAAGGEGKAKSGTEHAADLLYMLDAVGNSAESMRPNAYKAMEAMAEYTETNVPKQRRRAYKVIVPLLDALINYKIAKVALQPTAKVAPRTFNAWQVVEMMLEDDHEELGEIMGIEFTNPGVQRLLYDFAIWSENVLRYAPVTEWKEMATERLRRLANEEIALGW